jgi:phosphatidylserine/phosphatidylglycerophosphate/cardiolipin synthase-like enzyme
MSCVVILGSANWDANSATGNQKYFKNLIVSNLNHICMVVTRLYPGGSSGDM